MIKVNGLNKSYLHAAKKVNILKNINLEVEAGEVFGIIGKSGAGKSTLLKCLNLLEYPDSGTINIDGVDITNISKDALRKIRQKIGMVFQGFNLLNSKTVFANVALPLILNGNHSKGEIRLKVNNLLNLVGLCNYADKYPASLSGGQKQRVGIARALATDPKILLSDEATSALDPQTTNSILELLLEINEKLGLTIVLITHEIDVIRKVCDKVAVISNGEIIECGGTPNIFLHPQHAITRKLIVEEESKQYLEQVSDFYKFDKTANKHLVLMSFIGVQTFDPLLHQVAGASGVTFSILRGELGRIKKIPFGQLLVEVMGNEEQLSLATKVLGTLNVNFEIIA
jgi:D-methionine transport system ATP-binding protein